MREFVDKNGAGWNYGEKDVAEPATGKEFVLTQPKRIYNEDYYNITRAIAVENVPVDVVPEPDFFVYKMDYHRLLPNQAYIAEGHHAPKKVREETFLLQLLNNTHLQPRTFLGLQYNHSYMQVLFHPLYFADYKSSFRNLPILFRRHLQAKNIYNPCVF